jgi:hypothetical protein
MCIVLFLIFLFVCVYLSYDFNDLVGQDHADLCDDVSSECSKHGTLSCVCIPRTGAFVGLVFVEFAALESSTKAQLALNRRLFRGHHLECAYFDEQAFEGVKQKEMS